MITLTIFLPTQGTTAARVDSRGPLPGSRPPALTKAVLEDSPFFLSMHNSAHWKTKSTGSVFTFIGRKTKVGWVRLSDPGHGWRNMCMCLFPVAMWVMRTRVYRASALVKCVFVFSNEWKNLDARSFSKYGWTILFRFQNTREHVKHVMKFVQRYTA